MLLLTYVLIHYLLFSAFREFIGTLDPHYLPHVPTRQMLSEKLVPELFQELRSDIGLQLSQSPSLALSVELWTNDW